MNRRPPFYTAPLARSHGKDVMRNLAAAYGTREIVSSGSELSTGLSANVPATPSLSTHVGNNLAFTCSAVGVPFNANGLSVTGLSATAISWVFREGSTARA